MWIDAAECFPEPFVRVWVKTDTGRQTTAYIKSNGEWFINCERIRATGVQVVRWRH